MHELDRVTRIWTENLARAIDRRTFLKRVGQATFAAMATVAAGHGVSSAAAATSGGPKPPGPLVRPQCAPPGPFCNLDGNIDEPNGCHGGHCFQHLYNGQVLQCRIWYCCYQTGCWTTPVAGGYWTCCDCECGTPAVAHCGCAQFSANPIPLPDRSGGKTNA